MAREYIIPASALTVAATACTLVGIQCGTAAGTTVALEFLRAYCGQAANATSAQSRIQLHTQLTSFPTVLSQAPVAIKATDPVSKITGNTTTAAGTCGNNASGEGTGAKTVILPDSFNVLNGWLWVPTPAETIIESTSGTARSFGMMFPAAPSPTTAWSFGLVFREIG